MQTGKEWVAICNSFLYNASKYSYLYAYFRKRAQAKKIARLDRRTTIDITNEICWECCSERGEGSPTSAEIRSRADLLFNCLQRRVGGV